jgi:hypothetical protein
VALLLRAEEGSGNELTRGKIVHKVVNKIDNFADN